MRRVLASFGTFFAYAAILAICIYLTYSLTKSSLVPAPIRSFRSNPGAFRSRVDLIREDEKQAKVTTTLALCGVSQIAVEHDFIFFVFKGLPPDAIEVIGCPLRRGHHPEQLPADYINRNTFRFEMLDWEWFYWQFEPWGEVRKEQERAKKGERKGERGLGRVAPGIAPWRSHRSGRVHQGTRVSEGSGVRNRFPLKKGS